MSSTRDDSPSAPAMASTEEPVLSQSPPHYDDSAVMDAEATGGDSRGADPNDKRQPQRRRSTYEDFVEVFGA